MADACRPRHGHARELFWRENLKSAALCPEGNRFIFFLAMRSEKKNRLVAILCFFFALFSFLFFFGGRVCCHFPEKK